MVVVADSARMSVVSRVFIGRMWIVVHFDMTHDFGTASKIVEGLMLAVGVVLFIRDNLAQEPQKLNQVPPTDYE